MPRLMLLRLVAGLFAAATLVTSTWAFSQQSTGPGDGNSSFAGPDHQITNSFGVRPLDSNEHHLGVQQQGTFDPLLGAIVTRLRPLLSDAPAWQVSAAALRATPILFGFRPHSRRLRVFYLHPMR